jgi:hypothetical protein
MGIPNDGSGLPKPVAIEMAVEKAIPGLFPRSRPQETPRVSRVDNRRFRRRATLFDGC